MSSRSTSPDSEQSEPATTAKECDEVLSDHDEVHDSIPGFQQNRGFFAGQSIPDDHQFDPMDANTIGRANLSRIHEEMARFPWNKRMLSQLIGRHPRTRLALKRDWLDLRQTAHSVSVHATVQKRWSQLPPKLFRRAGGAAVASCGLFAVYKSEATLRLIMDARPANLLFERNPAGTLRFYALDEFLDALDQFIRPNKRNVFFLSGDFRHFYYQIPLDIWYARWLGIRSSHDVHYLPAVMAMGFFPAVEWGQTVTMTVILACREGEPLLGVDEQQVQDRMPTLVWLFSERIDTPAGSQTPAPPGQRVGFIAVLIDGFLLVTDRSKLRQRWHDRLKDNISRANLELKLPKADPVEATAPAQPPCTPPVAPLPGLILSDREVTFGGLKIVKHEGWTPATTLSPLPLPDPMSGTLTIARRELASHLGAVLWALRVRRKPLLHEGTLMKLFSRVGSGGKDWKATVTLTAREYRRLMLRIEALSAAGPCPARPLSSPVRWVFAVSDAHLTGVGWIIFLFNGRVLVPVRETYRSIPEGKQVHRESLACTMSILQSREVAIAEGWGEESPYGVCCAVDAESVRIPYTKRYSVSELIRVHLRAVYPKATWDRDFTHMVRVPGDDNVSDITSRGRYTYLVPRGFQQTFVSKDRFAERKRATAKILVAAAQHLMHGMQPPSL